MRKLTDGEREIIEEQERDARESYISQCDGCLEDVPESELEVVFDREDGELYICPSCMAREGV